MVSILLIRYFSIKIIFSFYHNNGKQRGYIETYNRQKNIRGFRIMGISITIIYRAKKELSIAEK